MHEFYREEHQVRQRTSSFGPPEPGGVAPQPIEDAPASSRFRSPIGSSRRCRLTTNTGRARCERACDLHVRPARAAWAARLGTGVLWPGLRGRRPGRGGRHARCVPVAGRGAGGADLTRRLLVAGALLPRWRPVGGRWGPVVGAHLRRRVRGGHGSTSPRPLAGTRVVLGRAAPQSTAPTPSPPPQLRGVRIISAGYHGRTIGALSEDAARRLTAVLACRVPAFALLDPDAQERRLTRWVRSCRDPPDRICGACSGSSARHRLRVDELARWVAGRTRSRPARSRGLRWIDSYLELIETAGTACAAARGPDRRSRSTLDAPASTRRAEAGWSCWSRPPERVARGLRAAEVAVLGARPRATRPRPCAPPLTRTQRPDLARLQTADPERTGLDEGAAWPVGSERGVGPLPLRWRPARPPTGSGAGPGSRSRLCSSPRCSAAAARCGPSQDLRAGPQRSLHPGGRGGDHPRSGRWRVAGPGLGESETARQRQSRESTSRREAELAAGHGEVRFSGFVTVSGRDPRRAACGRAQRSSIKPRARTWSCTGCTASRVMRSRSRSAGPEDCDEALSRASGPVIARRRGTPRPCTRSTSAGGLGGRGVFIGRESGGGAFCFDPWAAVRRGHIDDPNVIVLGNARSGQERAGQDAAVADAAVRPPGLRARRQARIRAAVSRGRACKPVSLVPGGGVRLNPLASRPEEHAQLDLLRAVGGHRAGRPAEPIEGSAARGTAHSAPARRRRADAARDCLMSCSHPTAEMPSGCRRRRSGWRRDARRAALALQDLCEGPLRGMFDGPTTPGLDLDAPARARPARRP